jgi:hypothetical protein
MIHVSATVEMPGSAEDAWALLTDWESHSRWVPATQVRVVEDTGGVGTRFVGRTGLGRLGFDDPMTVTELVPPSGTGMGLCTIRKTGTVVLGTAGFSVTPTGPRTCTATWWEDVSIAPTALTRWVEPLIARAGARSFERTLRAAGGELR